MNLENGLKKEWILTNGIGGFSYSTEVGCNTRKYHGLLVAALNPPARRFLILSKLDEALVINNKEHVLYTNMGKSYISEGYKNLAQFEKEYVPNTEKIYFDTRQEAMKAVRDGKADITFAYYYMAQ